VTQSKCNAIVRKLGLLMSVDRVESWSRLLVNDTCVNMIDTERDKMNQLG